MPYVYLEIADSTPAPVVGFIRESIENHFFADVHAMMRLPLPELGIVAAQNFTMVQVLTAVISSVSVALYKQTGQSGALFKEVIVKFFPWDRETGSGNPNAAAGMIYDMFRNPLTHASGLHLDWKDDNRYLVDKGYTVKVKRWLGPGRDRGMDESWIEALEESQDRPKHLGPTLQITNTNRVLLVEGLYWCTRRMIENLSHNSQHMKKAAKFLGGDT